MLVILSGVAGAGKDTVAKEVIKRMENVVSIPSMTDRPVRPRWYSGRNIYIYKHWRIQTTNWRKWIIWIWHTPQSLLWSTKKAIKWKNQRGKSSNKRCWCKRNRKFSKNFEAGYEGSYNIFEGAKRRT